MLFGKKKKTSRTISYGIVGLGRFGSALATSLIESGADVLVMDRDEEKLRHFREYTENALVVNSLDEKTLLSTGIQNCDIAVVCIGEHLDTSILTTLNLIRIGVPKVISKAVSAEHGLILQKLGAEVVYPERDMALRLASRLVNHNILDFVKLSEQINISKLFAPKEFIGMKVIEVNPRKRFGINIIAIEHDGKVLDNVRPDYIFKQGDIMYVSGSREGLDKLNEVSE